MAKKSFTEDFLDTRKDYDDKVMKYAGKNIKRFYNLDNKVYRDGCLSSKMKELMGLVASVVLRCDECIKYHLIRCGEEGVTDEELEEALSVALVVGGSVTIPHLRKAFDIWDRI